MFAPSRILAMVVVLLGLSLRCASAEDTGIGLVFDLSPPAFTDRDGRPTGYWIELAKLVSARSGVPIDDYINMPYGRALREISVGRRLCKALLARTKEREKDYAWIAPVQRMRGAIFVRAELADQVFDLAWLRRVRVGTMTSSFAVSELKAMAVAFESYTTPLQLVEMLARSRIDAIAADQQIGFSVARYAKVPVRVALYLGEVAGYFACSPSLDVETQVRLHLAVAEIFRDGDDLALARAAGYGSEYDATRPDIGAALFVTAGQ